VFVGLESKVLPPFDAKPAQERPKKRQRTNNEGAMKKRFKLEAGQGWEDAAGRQSFRRPVK
jgi:hypothetical protein